MEDTQKNIEVKRIGFEITEYSANLIHGLLVDEEIRLKEKIPILLAEFDYDFDKTKAYVEEVKTLRKFFTHIDHSEDYLGVFSRIEDYKLDKEKNYRRSEN